MEYRDFLIYLNSQGIENLDIIEIEKFLEKENLHYKEFLNEKYLKSLEGKIKKSLFIKLNKNNISSLEEYYENCEKENISIITSEDIFYPENLKRIINPPRVLYVKGQLKKEDYYSIAIVGARKHTSYGELVVDYIVDSLKDYNITITSGLAYGIDSLAHKRALEKDLRTIAVLGCGIDVIYPKSNKFLYEEIEKRGAIISEYRPKLPPNAYRFPIRNRIISGLSLGTIVVEASEKSGSIITGRIAAEQGREVFAVPGPINSIYSKGTNSLIRDGANIFTSIDDLIGTIEELKNRKKDIIKKSSDNLGEDELKIVNQIKEGVNDINKIAFNLKEDISFISSILTVLELKNIVVVSGNKVELKI